MPTSRSKRIRQGTVIAQYGMNARFSNDGSKETTTARLCIGNCVPKAIVARQKRSIAISHAYARLVKDHSHWRKSGQTEGQITRLKLLKRSMYGRAKFDLLRLRVLHRTEDNPKVDKTTRKVHQRPQDPATVPRSGEKTVNSQHTTAVISEVAYESGNGSLLSAIITTAQLQASSGSRISPISPCATARMAGSISANTWYVPSGARWEIASSYRAQSCTPMGQSLRFPLLGELLQTQRSERDFSSSQ